MDTLAIVAAAFMALLIVLALALLPYLQAALTLQVP